MKVSEPLAILAASFGAPSPSKFHTPPPTLRVVGVRGAELAQLLVKDMDQWQQRIAEGKVTKTWQTGQTGLLCNARRDVR